MNIIFLIIIGIPLVEIFVMIKIGSYVGAFNTIMLIFLTAITGIYFARLEGLNTIRAGFNQLIKNELITYGNHTYNHYLLSSLSYKQQKEEIEKNITFLATAGSTAPFIGLFGTVWGIMNRFQSIAIAQNTNLAVVAPGIAEALFATALGLFVAIPAVVAYNKISSDLSKYFMSLESFIDQFSTIFFRQLESN